MKKFFIIAMAAIAVLGSCSSDNGPGPAPVAPKFTATITEGADVTRATYNDDEKCAQWAKGDVISINGQTFKADAAGVTTTFTWAGETVPAKPYKAYFACDYDGITASLPSVVNETVAGTFNMPMYAESSSTTLEFKNLCGVLKITVKKDANITAVKSINISSKNKATSGEFTINAEGAAVLTNPDEKTNTVTVAYQNAVAVTDAGTTFYVAVPAQSYRELKIQVKSSTGASYSMTTRSDMDITVQRSNIYGIAFQNYTTEHVMPGVFSVSATKKVQFTDGNLYWDGSEFKFENSQLERTLSIASPVDFTHVSHFFWTSLNDYNTGTPKYMPYATKYDFYSRSGSDKYWCGESNKLTVQKNTGLYVLTSDEWNYLVYSRENAANLRLYKNIDGVSLCLIAPDGFTELKHVKTTADVEELVAKGVICLAPVGRRCDSGGGASDGRSIQNANNGYYATSTPDAYNYNNFFEFSQNYTMIKRTYSRHFGAAIRLVKTVE